MVLTVEVPSMAKLFSQEALTLIDNAPETKRERAFNVIPFYLLNLIVNYSKLFNIIKALTKSEIVTLPPETTLIGNFNSLCFTCD